MRSGRYARARMEAAISCKFHCKRLAEHWRGYWPGADAAELAADVEERLAAATAAWSLRDIEPLDGGVVALTCGATQHGRPVVLKLNPRGHPDDAQLAGEGDALAFWSPTGVAAELLDQRDGGFTLLLERLQPGYTLEVAPMGLEERLAEIGRLVARLHTAGPPPLDFIHAREFEPAWELPESGEQEEEVLTHLDLHAGNALRTPSGWKVIDPKGVRADRHADVWALIDPLTLEDFPHDPGQAEATAVRRLELYAQAAEMDLAKAREWTRIRAAAEAEQVHDSAWAGALRRMAAALG
jgi:streptomycin 6-kinase